MARMKTLAELLLYAIFLSALPVILGLAILLDDATYGLLFYAVAIVVAGGLWLLGERPRS
jgi:hypothetical protein